MRDSDLFCCFFVFSGDSEVSAVGVWKRACMIFLALIMFKRGGGGEGGGGRLGGRRVVGERFVRVSDLCCCLFSVVFRSSSFCS